MRRQSQAVRTLDGHVTVLQRPCDRGRKAVALAHEDQDIAGPNGFAGRFQRLAALDPSADRVGNARCGARHGVIDRNRIESARPILVRVGGVARLFERPQVDMTRFTPPPRFVHHGRAVQRQAIGGRWLGEHCIHRVEDVRHGTERQVQLHIVQLLARFVGQACEVGALVREAARLGTLERVDGLLEITHGEHGARAFTRAFAVEELAREPLDDAPLQGGGVLRLVHQDVIDAAIELVVNPAPAAIAIEKLGGSGDHVVEIEQPATMLECAPLLVQPLGHDHGVRAGRA